MDEQGYQAKTRHTAIPAVYLILQSTAIGSILLALRKGTGYMDGYWDLPSGHVELGELPTQAMAREAKEEIGVLVARKNLTLVHTSYRPVHDKTGDRADYVFQAEIWHKKPRICEPDKCEKLDWFLPSQIAGQLPVVPHVREFIRCWKKSIRFSEFDVKWLKAHGMYKL